MPEDHVHPPTEIVGGDPVRRQPLCKTRPEHGRPELDDESDLVDKYQRVEVVDHDAPGMGGERTKLTLPPPEEYDTEDTKEIEVDDLDMAEVLKLAQNEGLDPTAVEVGIRKEMKGLQDFGVYQEICKIPSVCEHLFPESTFDSKPVLVLLSFVSGRLVELVSGHPRSSSVQAPVYRACPCRAPPVCHRVQDGSLAKRQPFFVLVGVVTSCVPCARVRGRVSRSENTYTPARLEALLKLSVVTILRQFVSFAPKISAGCGCSLHLVILFEISTNFSCLLPAVPQSLLFT